MESNVTRPAGVFRPLARASALALLAVLGGSVPAQTQDSRGNVFLPGDELGWSESGSESRFAPLYGSFDAAGEVFAFRLELRDGFEIGPHTHPGTEHLTVLRGRLRVGLGDVVDRAAARSFGPGSYLAVAGGVVAYMWAEGETVVQVHGVGPFSTEFVDPSER